MQNTLIYTFEQGVERAKEVLQEDLVKEFLTNFSSHKYSDIISDDTVCDFTAKAYHLLNCRLLYDKQLAKFHEDRGIVFLPVEYARWLPVLCTILAALGNNMLNFDAKPICRLSTVIREMISTVNDYVSSSVPNKDDVEFKNDEEVLKYIFSLNDNKEDKK